MCSIGSISSIGLLGSRGLLQIEPISLVSPPFLLVHHLNGGRTSPTEKKHHLPVKSPFLLRCFFCSLFDERGQQIFFVFYRGEHIPDTQYACYAG